VEEDTQKTVQPISIRLSWRIVTSQENASEDIARSEGELLMNSFNLCLLKLFEGFGGQLAIWKIHPDPGRSLLQTT
jgi:hypothetical protein